MAKQGSNRPHSMPQMVLRFLFVHVGALMLMNQLALAASEEPDPTQWTAAMSAFEIANAECPPTPNEIVFTGSSSIAMWKTIATDIAPLRVINRGFGGSTMADAVYWLDAVALARKPRAIVVYEGDNDIAFGSQ